MDDTGSPAPETLRIGIAQWLATPGGHEANFDRAESFVHELSERGAELVVLPEMWISGYRWTSIAEDARSCAEPLSGPRGERLARLASECGVWLVAGSVPEICDGAIYNTMPVYSSSGELVGRHRKAHLYSPLNEDEVFQSGDAVTTLDTPFGTIGLSICMDGDFPEFARALRRRGAGVVVQASAYEIGAERWWDALYPAHALANGQLWIMANQCGTHDADTLLGASRVISPTGEVLAEGRRARSGDNPDEDLLVVDVRLRELSAQAARSQAVLWESSRPEIYG